MLATPCPEWTKEDVTKIPDIARAASSVYDFMVRQNAKQYVLDHGDFKLWHLKLFEKAVPLSYYAGNYRGKDSSRPCLEEDVAVGPNPGVPHGDVLESMRRFSEELKRAIKDTDSYVARNASAVQRLQAAAQLAAFAGGSIIRIHPFLNGNGRIARLAMNFILYRYLGKTPFFIDRPPHPDYSTASKVAMGQGNFVPLYQYLIDLMVPQLVGE